MLYCYNLLCYVKYLTSLLTFKVDYVTSSTSLLTFKAVAMSLYYVTSSTSLLTFKAVAMSLYYLTSSTSLLTFKAVAMSLYHVTSSDAHVLWLQWMSQLPTNLWFLLILRIYTTLDVASKNRCAPSSANETSSMYCAIIEVDILMPTLSPLRPFLSPGMTLSGLLVISHIATKLQR